MNCPRDFATTAVFAIASGAIGNRIQTNDGVYKNRLNINVCHVAPPGSNKTAPVSLLLKPLDYWHTFVKCLWNIAPMEFTFSDAAQKLQDEYYRKIAEKKIEAKDCNTYMSEVRDKLFVYSQKWAGLANVLHGDCVPFGLNKYDNRFVDGKPCKTIISGEAMKYAIDCMDVFEHWAERVHSKIEENDTVKITLADAIRVVNDFYPISNKSQFAQSCGMTRELLYKYLPKGKDPTPPK